LNPIALAWSGIFPQRETQGPDPKKKQPAAFQFDDKPWKNAMCTSSWKVACLPEGKLRRRNQRCSPLTPLAAALEAIPAEDWQEFAAGITITPKRVKQVVHKWRLLAVLHSSHNALPLFFCIS
jgi:hypothetical protein